MEFNFIYNIEERDKELFFGPLTDADNFIEIQKGWTMANIVCQANIFNSLTQARKNGFNNEIPFGFTDKRIGKLKTRITILNWSK
jgi:hypothetical protein